MRLTDSNSPHNARMIPSIIFNPFLSPNILTEIESRREPMAPLDFPSSVWISTYLKPHFTKIAVCSSCSVSRLSVSNLKRLRK